MQKELPGNYKKIDIGIPQLPIHWLASVFHQSQNELISRQHNRKIFWFIFFP